MRTRARGEDVGVSELETARERVIRTAGRWLSPHPDKQEFEKALVAYEKAAQVAVLREKVAMDGCMCHESSPVYVCWTHRKLDELEPSP